MFNISYWDSAEGCWRFLSEVNSWQVADILSNPNNERISFRRVK